MTNRIRKILNFVIKQDLTPSEFNDLMEELEAFELNFPRGDPTQ